MKYFYEIWDNGNLSCCSGKMFTVASKRNFMLTFLTLNAPTVLHEILHIQWYSNQGLFFGTFIIFTFHYLINYFLLFIFTSDPGIVTPIIKNYQTDTQTCQIPYNKKILAVSGFSYLMVAKTHAFRFKFCRTCNNFRAPRTIHCDECGTCIQRYDRHCSWLGKCIGKRNYRHFYFFIASSTVLLITTVAMAFIILTSSPNNIKSFPFSVILIVIDLPLAFVAFYMLAFHSYLIFKNLTTQQYLKNTWAIESGNPFQKSLFLKNYFSLFFKFPKSLITLRREVYHDDLQSGTGQESNKAAEPNQQNAVQPASLPASLRRPAVNGKQNEIHIQIHNSDANIIGGVSKTKRVDTRVLQQIINQ